MQSGRNKSARVLTCLHPFLNLYAAVFYPIQMWRRVYQPHGARSLLMTIVNVIMGLVALVATIGSIETIVASASHFKPFSGAGGGGHGR